VKTNKRRFPAKTENESKFYGIDWKPEVKTGSISSVAWSAEPGGLTFSNGSTSGTITRTKIAGGDATREYTVTAKMTKANGEVCEAVCWLRVNPSDEVA